MSRSVLRSIVVALPIALLSSCGSSQPQDSGNAASPAVSASTAEPAGSPSASEPGDDGGLDFSVKTFEGTEFSLADQRGTPVVLNFWESW